MGKHDYQVHPDRNEPGKYRSVDVINKTVSMSRDVRPPKPNEEIFGATLDGTELTRESVTEAVRDTLIH